MLYLLYIKLGVFCMHKLKRLIKSILIAPPEFNRDINEDIIFRLSLIVLFLPYYIIVPFVGLLLLFLGVDVKHIRKYNRVATFFIMSGLLTFYMIVFGWFIYMLLLSGLFYSSMFLFLLVLSMIILFFLYLFIAMGSIAWQSYAR